MWRALGMAVLACGALLSAQDPHPSLERDVAQLTKELASDSAREVAWAAHHARELGDKRLLRPLQQALTKWRSGQHDDRSPVCMLLLDALLTLDARLPGSELLPLVDDGFCGGAAFVLLAREPQVNAMDMLAMFRRDWRGAVCDQHHQEVLRCHAIGNLLAAQRMPGFAAVVANYVDFDLHVQTGIPTRVAAPPDDRVISMPEKFPPAARYQLLRTGASWSATPLVDGPVPISYRRSRGWLTGMNSRGHFDGFAWLVAMADIESPPVRELTVPVPAPTTWVEQVATARQQLQQCVDTMRERLVAKRAMTAEQAKLLLRKVEVRAHADGEDRSLPARADEPLR